MQSLSATLPNSNIFTLWRFCLSWLVKNCIFTSPKYIPTLDVHKLYKTNITTVEIITIKDIAKALNLSTSTVSRADLCQNQGLHISWTAYTNTVLVNTQKGNEHHVHPPLLKQQNPSYRKTINFCVFDWFLFFTCTK